MTRSQAETLVDIFGGKAIHAGNREWIVKKYLETIALDNQVVVITNDGIYLYDREEDFEQDQHKTFIQLRSTRD